MRDRGGARDPPGQCAVAIILILFVVAGAADALFRPASQAVLFDMAGRARLESANSISTLLVRGAGLMGPAIGGLFVVASGIDSTLLISAGTFLIGAAAVASSRHVPALSGAAPMSARTLWHEAADGVRVTMRTGWLRAVLLSDLSQMFLAVAPWFVLLPITLMPQGTATYAVAVTAFAGGGLLGALTPLWLMPRAIGRQPRSRRPSSRFPSPRSRCARRSPSSRPLR